MVNKNHLKAKLDEIYNELCTQKKQEIGLLNGQMGIALFHYYYGHYLNDVEIKAKGTSILTNICGLINQGYNQADFCSGLCGIAWGIEILKEDGLEFFDTDLLLDELDGFIANVLPSHFWNNHFDLLYGYLGFGVYLLKRYQNSKSNGLKSIYFNSLSEILTHLDNTAYKTKNEAYWISEKRDGEQTKKINLGLAHGMASIINFLSRLTKFPEFRPKSKSLLRKSCRFILHSKNSSKNSQSLFPNFQVIEQKEKEFSRLAWCFGDLGIGVSLLHAANSLNDKFVYKEAIEILIHSSKRHSLANTKVKDAGICHGAFGVMHIFDYLFKKSAIKDFRDAREFWLKEGMGMAYHSDGLAGFMSWQPNDRAWNIESDLLDGVSGIGLAILSYLNPQEIRWNQCLMIS